MNFDLRKLSVLFVVGSIVITGGCHRKRRTRSQPKSDAYADQLKSTVAQSQIKVMHFPDFKDYQAPVQTFYDDRNFEVAWITEDNKPTPQAAAFIKAFQEADQKGLKPEDYDASLWPARVQGLAAKNDDATAQFDAIMTVCVMRYISDLRIGRVNPTHFNFDINVQEKKYDLPEFVSDNAVDAEDVPKLIASVEPDSDQYRETEKALPRYRALARQQGTFTPLPAVPKPLAVGQQYADVKDLRARLQLEGDLAGDPVATTPAPAAPPRASQPDSGASAKPSRLRSGVSFLKQFRGRQQQPQSAFQASPQSLPQPAPQPPPQVLAGAYTPELSDAVKHYQARHGLAQDGKLTPATIASLNVPLSVRTQQIVDSLERWRWLPNEYLNAPLMVNLPEFVLRGFGPDHREEFKMNVVVGQVLGEHETPVFTNMMKFIIFRPYWNVPVSIVKKELVGHIAKSGIGYLSQKNFETTDRSGQVVEASASAVEHGEVNVREKPGPTNSLGLIKFMFPNEYDIYMHSTPAQQLFARSRRDFSHGCVRLEHPDQLAEWVLKDNGDWPLDKIQDAMQNGPDNHQVNLKKPVPVVIFYTTARVDENGDVDFFDDIYGYDKSLNDVLEKGMPYPSRQQKVDPHAKAGDTA